ncbi:MAG: hypothetical protein HY866_19040 [Chloroflexi bacterium]|nr:hypothetical protein [Chloroflexota bacterium]
MPQQTNGNGNLLRPRYFDRQQLTAPDLNQGLTYVRERLRRHNRFMHGWGVVCGAEVWQTDAAADPWQMSVGEGYVVTPRGDEVYIPSGAAINIESAVLGCLGTSEDCPDVHLARAMINPAGVDVRPQYNGEWVEVGLADTVNLAGYVVQHTLNIDTPRERLATYYRFTENTVFEAGSVIRIHSGAAAHHADPPLDRINRYVADPGEVGNWHFNNMRDRLRILDPAGNVIDEQIFLPDSELPISAGTVYLAVCAHDILCAPLVAMPEQCAPAGGQYEYSRICEGYDLRVLCRLPPSHTDDLPGCNDLEAFVCGDAMPPCPPTTADDDCVVLATIRVRAEPVEIDYLRDRRILLSESLLREYLRCQCGQIPTPAPTVAPTVPPTTPPTIGPTFGPTVGPTFGPTVFPTFIPTFIGTLVPTVFPTFIQPTVFPTFIQPTVLPTFIASVPPIGPIDFTDLDTDLGLTLPVTEIPNVGPARGALLESAGIDNVLSFASRPTAELAGILNISEVRAAEMQMRARELMVRG